MSVIFTDLEQKLQERLMEGRPLLNGGWLHCEKNIWYWKPDLQSDQIDQVGKLTAADVRAIKRNDWTAVCQRLKLPAPAIYHLLLEDRDSPEQVILGGLSISDLTAQLEKLGRKFPRWIVTLMEIDKDGWWIPLTPPKIWERKFDIKSTRK